MAAVALAAAALFALAACGEKKAPAVSGIGKYKFTTTKLKHVRDGNCQPTELSDGRKGTWCFSLPGFKISKSIVEMDLYFLGQDPEASLIEIQLKIRGCVEADVESWMRAAFGPPIESKATRAYWKNQYLWAAALLPSEPARCIVHLLPLSENSEIERIKLE